GAHAGDVVLQGVHGAIRPLYEQQQLELQGHASGPLAGFLRYVTQSPIDGMLEHALAAATATGNGDLDLALALPLSHAQDSTLTGRLTLPGNDVRMVPGLPTLADTRARVDFTTHGVTVANASAHALGGELTFTGGTQPDGNLRFQAQGVATAEGLRRAVETPLYVRLASHLNGQAPYRLQLGIVKGLSEFTLDSGLEGLGVTLPAPLGKLPAAAWPLHVSTTLAADAAGKPRDTLRVVVGPGPQPVLQAEVLRDLSGPDPIPLRAAYAIGATLPAPQPGGVALVHATAVEGDTWWSFWKSLDDGAVGPAPVSPVPLGNPAVPAAGAVPGPDYWPASATLRADTLAIGGQRLTGVDLQLARSSARADETWRADITSTQAHGFVEYKPDTPTRNAHVYARLDRLVLDASAADTGAKNAASPSSAAQTASVPSLDIVVDDFELGAKKLGKLEVSATAQAGGRDWRLGRLAMTMPEAKFVGSGQWSGTPRRQMALDFDLTLVDSGEFLQRLAMGRVLKGGKGSLSGHVTWLGSPLSLDIPSLGGQLQIALDKGQFLKANAGAARLLGVLSLQSLPRRLLLDFRDVFSEGFAFDNVTGDARIEHGVATTNNLRMRGLSAAVLMEGDADLQAETQDLHVVVVPEINAGAASLAYAAINPVVGLGTFLAQLFLSHPLAKAGTREFHVTGPWADPKVEAIERKGAGDAARATEAPASAAEPDAPSGAASAAETSGETRETTNGATSAGGGAALPPAP
ncbi:MAG TPA: AsmA-like C-terminal region-containing protein, partial [Burkholderiaceae bacterium]|nr:AsmA-like C-terminal region-containing protein [Burkholderiaceae bacterium]